MENAKILMAKNINDFVKFKRLTQKEAAEHFRTGQSIISSIANYKFEGISFERLAFFCNLADIKLNLRINNETVEI